MIKNLNAAIWSLNCHLSFQCVNPKLTTPAPWFWRYYRGRDLENVSLVGNPVLTLVMSSSGTIHIPGGGSRYMFMMSLQKNNMDITVIILYYRPMNIYLSETGSKFKSASLYQILVHHIYPHNLYLFITPICMQPEITQLIL